MSPNAKLATRTDAAQWHSSIASQFDGRYARSPAFKERLQVWSELIATYVPSDGVVLDAGCGSGVLSMVAARQCRWVTGIDGGDEMIRLCQEKQKQLNVTNVAFSIARLEDLSSLGHAKFDTILCSSVLEYLDDLWMSVDMLTARLVPGGCFIFSLPNTASLYRQMERAAFKATGRPRYYGLVRSFLSRAAILEGLAKRGFEVADHRFYAATPGLSHLAHTLGLAQFSDNLQVYVCRTARP